MNSALLTIDDFASKNIPAIVDYLKEDGMIVGNHSYSHPAFSSLTLEECIDEIEKCEKVLERLYEDSGVERRYKPFRFPYGNKGGDNKDALQKSLCGKK